MTAYNPHEVESQWLSFWKEKDLFKADAHATKPPFSMVIPPPNVTGVLHMGHALVNTLQDIIARYKRMDGYEVLWVPGTDHAGIATQTVVERHLIQTTGKRRGDFSREAFLKEIWQWKEKSEVRILEQLARLGCSCDWSRQSFTMDEGCNKAVRTLFKRLYDKGLIYRGNYLVNWDPVTQTALADDEVEYEERESFLWTFSYPLADGSGEIHIATTRPETMLGDTAVAVSPKDERYRHLIGKTVLLPIMEREIPIIADNYVDPSFGTGVVKITPAHDPNDYKIGLAHNLPMISIMHPDGVLNENAGPFAGIEREKARTAVVSQMEQLSRLVKVDRYTLRVGVSYRSKAVIEPMLSKQWFVKMSSFVGPLKEAVETKKVRLTPSLWEQTYYHWIDNLRDWCISRQLWWGHRIPVWYNIQDPKKMICHDGEGIPPEVANDPENWEQDPDVLDTWFSSALWPLSTLGWPNKTADFEKFYPTSLLVTGHDILFFWVARMIAVGQYVTPTPPFPETFLHGLIYGRSYWRDNENGGITYVTGDEKRQYDLGVKPPKGVKSKWEKLSKSKGNVIDPLDLIDEYGTDALRMTLCSIANQTPQIDLDRRRFEEFKNFANKIWNGARFVLMNLQDFKEVPDNITLAFEDEWILTKLSSVTQKVRKALDSYQFDEAAQTAYNFFWNEFCAYYVEFSKPILYGENQNARQAKQKILLDVLLNAVCLLHPIAPFITEELFQTLKKQFGHLKEFATLQATACAVAPYPKPGYFNPTIEKQFALLDEVIYKIRNIRGEMKIPPHVAIEIYLTGPFSEEWIHLVSALIKTKEIHKVSSMPDLSFSATGVAGEIQISIPLPKELVEQEKKRLEKEKIRLEKLMDQISNLLENQAFLNKACADLVDRKKTDFKAAQNALATIQEKLNS